MSVLVALGLAAAMVRPPKEIFDLSERRRKTFEYADCVVRLRPEAATRIVLQQVSPNELDRDFKRINLSSCVPGFNLIMSMPRPILQFALADALIRAKHVALPADLSTIAPLNHGSAGPDVAKAVLDKGNKATEAEKLSALRTAAAIELSRFGECVVRNSPTQTQALLQTGVASPAEATAFTALSTSLGVCLDKGQKVALSRDAVRGTVALNYYRLASAARTPQLRGTAE